jgi:hypothetical protein
MPPVKPMPAPPDARIIPLDRQTPLTHQQVEEVRFGLGDTGPLAQAVMNANVPALAKQLAQGAVSCLSSRRPADPVVGQMIYESDTKVTKFWDGTAWVSGLGATPTNVIPVGMLSPYAGTSAPANWLLCDGSAVSRTTYAALFAVTSTAYGVGDGSTTFNVPDLRGRVPAGLDNMGGTPAGRLTAAGSGITGTTLGANGGTETHTLTVAQMPTHSHGVSASASVGVSGADDNNHTGNGDFVADSDAGYTGQRGVSVSVTIANNGSSAAHNNTQPTIITS